MRDRWQRGDSVPEIASLYDRHYSSVLHIFSGQMVFALLSDDAPVDH